MIIPTKDMTAVTTAQALNSRIFGPLGIPESVRSDNALMFTGNYMKELNDLFRIKQVPAIANAPHTNGQVERYVGIVTHSLQTLMHTYKKKPEQFLDALSTIASVTNSTPNRMTGYSAFELLFHRKPRSLLNELHKIMTAPPTTTAPAAEARDHISEYLRLAIQMQRELTIHAIQNLRRHRKKMIEQYNLGKDDFRPENGDIIMINFERARRKRDLDPLFQWRSLGPFMIIGHTPNTLLICDWSGKPHGKPVHIIHARKTTLRDDTLFDEARNKYINNVQEYDYDDENQPVSIDTMYNPDVYTKQATDFVPPTDAALADTVDDLDRYITLNAIDDSIPADDRQWEML